MATVFTDAGEGKVVDLLDTIGWWIAQGTGTNAANVTDTTLQTEASESRVASTDTQPSANVFQSVSTITADGTKAVTEAGLFDASTAGVMISRSVFAAINVVAGNTITFTFQCTFTGS